MFRNIFSQIEGVTDFPLAVLVFFFLFFIGVIAMVFSLRKDTVKHMENIPLQDEEADYLPKLHNKVNKESFDHSLNGQGV
jgi:cbb3-type cytochrome oxidase subunit 3